MATQSSVRSRGMELLISYKHNPSVEIRNQLVRLNIGLVRKIAHRVSHQCAEPYEDLEQIGYLGLIRAIERFDPTQGCAFSSFAVPYIRGEMLHFLRDKGSSVRIPRRWQELQREGQKVREEFTNNQRRSPSEAEIAQQLGVSVQEWRDSQLATQNCTPLSLDATVSQQVETPMTLGDTLLDVNYQSLQRAEEERQQLHSALGELEEKTREVIEFVFLNDISRKDVAKQIGVSPMTVTRRIQRGVEELVSLLRPQIA
ncbi:RNA polymerase sigma factor SigF [Microcoleus sp. FACHB-68]|uniref:RNA polymerase sigma factor SigF n=1 Tax=Microcoleus sp. FACHB-68 TaxID=2692826 RepID=UPI0016823B4F|nr:RNA polymerase sigma factor SigF [Microcoleus sp. FACHB-68]MBD1937643.1 RNA polymerase sigma factor SigF [Microcoleus sp. FACHB-68]